MINLQRLIKEAAKIVGKIDLSHLQQNDAKDVDKVSKKELDGLEKILDALFAKIGIDVAFTRHFLDRVNDKRNKKQITIPELQALFTKTYQKYSNVIGKAEVDWEAVINDVSTEINVPFVINYDKRNGLELVAKTTMRKSNFKTKDRKLKV